MRSIIKTCTVRENDKVIKARSVAVFEKTEFKDEITDEFDSDSYGDIVIKLLCDLTVSKFSN